MYLYLSSPKLSKHKSYENKCKIYERKNKSAKLQADQNTQVRDCIVWYFSTQMHFKNGQIMVDLRRNTQIRKGHKSNYLGNQQIIMSPWEKSKQMNTELCNMTRHEL